MAVVHMIVGAPTSDGATFVAKVDTGPVRIAVADNADMTGPVFTDSEAVDGNGVAKLAISGLSPRTRYWWRVEDDGAIDTSVTGRFRTAPVAGSVASFTFAASGDAGAGSSGFVTDRVSNHPVFDEIREADPDFFCYINDMHYRDIGTGVHESAPFNVDSYRDAFDDILTYNGAEGTDARQQRTFREIPLVPTWGNHDYGATTGSAIDSDRTLPHRAAARQAFRERMPHYPMAAGDGDEPIYYAFSYGRVLFVVWDVRSERDPNTDTDDADKTMLGSAQKAWLDNLLATSDAKALCVISAVPWLTRPTESDTWQAYSHERDEITQMFIDRGWRNRMWLMTAHMHALGLDTGSLNHWGGFPSALFAALDATPANPAANLYDRGTTRPGVGQWGTCRVDDNGTHIRVTLTAMDPNGVWDEFTFAIGVQSPTEALSADVAELAPILAGSHDPVVEARIIGAGLSGADPDGDTVEVIDGDVQYDATAEAFASLSLTVPGVDPDTGRSRFPRLQQHLLMPYATHEVFVRRGVDIGASVLWVPLGFFLIESVEQDDDPEAPITIGGRDRMGPLIDWDVPAPREFGALTSVAAFMASLVGDFYPDATIAFDDAAGFELLGRTIVVDETRYAAMREVVDGLGKVMHWDGEGILRVEDAPDADDLADPVWQIRAGRNGVLIRATRRLSNLGAPNGIIVYGEGGTEDPVSGAAVDLGPKSPTRWGGAYGRRPIKETLPTVTTQAQAQAAAREKLRRHLGIPHSADFGTLVNPALRPRMPILVEHRDGSRDRHVVETLTVPLLPGGEMSGTTRERTHQVIGSQVEVV